jgi:hypothetical protein
MEMTRKPNHLFNVVVLVLILGCLAVIGREVFKPKNQPAPAVPAATPAPASEPEKPKQPERPDRISLGEDNAG